jgi:hypothetical protein
MAFSGKPGITLYYKACSLNKEYAMHFLVGEFGSVENDVIENRATCWAPEDL